MGREGRERTEFEAKCVNALCSENDIGAGLQDHLDALLDDIGLAVADALQLGGVSRIQHNSHGHLVLVEVEV